MFRKNLKRQKLSVTLEEDLEHLCSYMIIEKARFEDQLDVRINIEPDIMKTQMPCLTLQPLLENAIKHGMSSVIGCLEVDVNGYLDQGVAVIEVKDNAGAFQESGNGDGLGLAIVDKRIKGLWGSSFGVSVSYDPNEHTTVTVKLPTNEVSSAV
jgi:two-component system LytT family sensor kinase